MAVYTPVSEKDLTVFLQLYSLGKLVSFQGISEGVENSNFLVVTWLGQYILTLFERRVSSSDLPWFMGLMGHLASKGIDCPLPIADKKGKVIQTLLNKPAVFCSFLQGKGLVQPRLSHCYQLGKVLARFHLAGQDFASVRPNNMGIETWPALWKKCASAANRLEEGLQQFIDAQLQDVIEHWPEYDPSSSALPIGQIHADLFPDNVFFQDDKLSGIIDFYFACTDLWIYDIAICINSWCFNPAGTVFYTEYMEAILKGYEEIRPLTPQEQSVFPVCNKGAALRFFLSRLYDWENTPQDALVTKKSPLDYVHRLRFFDRSHLRYVAPPYSEKG